MLYSKDEQTISAPYRWGFEADRKEYVNTGGEMLYSKDEQTISAPKNKQ